MTDRYSISRTRKITYFFTALLLSVILVRIFIIDSFMVSGDSMAPTLITGDYIFVNKLAYKMGKPERGDIVVGNFRDMNGQKIIKRIAGLPGEWVFITGGIIFVSNERDGERLEVGKLDSEHYLDELGESSQYRLDPHEYFLVGDNGLASVDSRLLGPVDIYRLNGKMFFKLRFR